MAFVARTCAPSPPGSSSADVKFFRELHDGIYGLTIYIADPDGNMIEFFEPDAKM